MKRFLFGLFFSFLFFNTLYGVNVKIIGTPIVKYENNLISYRFRTQNFYHDKAIDLLLKIVDISGTKDDRLKNLVVWSTKNNTIAFNIAPPKCRELSLGHPYADINVSFVEKDTTNVIRLPEIVLTGFELDTWIDRMWGDVMAKDYLLAQKPSAIILDRESKLSVSNVNVTGWNGVLYQIQLNPYRDDCTKSIKDRKCNGSLLYKNVSSLAFRVYTTSYYYSRKIGVSFSSDVLSYYQMKKDYSDAPKSYSDAYHEINKTLYLGSWIFPDEDNKANYSKFADSDDKNKINHYDDEDGITLNGKDLQKQILLKGVKYNLHIKKVGKGYLFGWVDWNHDGSFSEDEKIINGLYSSKNDINITLSIPKSVKSGLTYARFRYSNLSSLQATGDGGMGEVEDYSFTIIPECTQIFGRSKVGKNQISWSQKSNHFYKLYRATELNGTFKNIYSGRGAVYIDRNISTDTSYYYKIEEIDTQKNICNSQVIKIYAPAKREKMAQVPNLLLKPYTTVTTLLNSVNLFKGNVASKINSSIPKGKIFLQSPSKYSFVKAFTKINITISDDSKKSYLHNHKPVIVSSPPLTLQKRYNGQYFYSYNIVAKDKDGDKLFFKIINPLSNMSLSNARRYDQNSWQSRFYWKPDISKQGFIPITIEVSDSKGAKSYQKWNLYVNFLSNFKKINHEPVISSIPKSRVKYNTTYIYEVNATDADNDKLYYHILQAPSGMYFQGNKLIWDAKIDPKNKKNSYKIIIGVTDCKQAIAMQSWNLSIIGTNHPPIITSTPPTTAKTHIRYRYSVRAVDKDSRDYVRYKLIKAPYNIIYKNTDYDLKYRGEIVWTPDENQTGEHTFIVRATDRYGSYVEQKWIVNVEPNHPPIITSTPPTTAKTHVNYLYYIKAKDKDSRDYVVTPEKL